jgi:RNA polymerase sigma-70 factor (ECF subfamily)
MSTAEQQRTEQFLQLYSNCEAQLFAYLVTILGNRSDAEEVFQETTLALWRSFPDFEAGTSFVVWAKRVAFHRVLSFRKAQQRAPVLYSEEFLSSVHRALERQSDLLDARMQALADCINKLSDSDRHLVALRYAADRRVTDLATELNRPVNTLYKALERIRYALIECVNRAVAREEHA